MFLSKLSIQPRHSSQHSYLEAIAGGPYKLHQLVWQLFSSDDKRKHLFREEQSSTGLPVIYTLSEARPDESHQIFCVQTKLFEPKLNSGMRLSYSLRVNPTVSKDGKRHDVLMNAKRELDSELSSNEVRNRMQVAAQEWFASPQRLDRWGFSLDYLPQVDSYIQHKTRRREEIIRYSSVDLQGVLTVREPDLFLGQLTKGFGKSKAFGCGLMLIRRV